MYAQIARCPDARMPRCPDAQMPRSPDSQMPGCPDARMPRCPDAREVPLLLLQQNVINVEPQKSTFPLSDRAQNL